MDKEFEETLEDINLTRLDESAQNAVVIAVFGTTATSAVPIPFADAPLLVSEQVVLMARICSIYQIDISEDGLTMLAAAALEAGGATVIGKTIAGSLFKLIPGVGSAAGAAISGVTAGAVTWAMGMSFIEVCRLVKCGAMSEADLTSQKGRDELKKRFRKQLASKLANK